MPTSNDPARPVFRPQAAVTAGSAGRADRRSRAAKRHQRRVMLALAVALLRDRRFRENVIIAVIILAALAQLAREGGTRNRARLFAWLDREPASGGRAAHDRPAIDRAA
jgi:hypothetical protein